MDEVKKLMGEDEFKEYLIHFRRFIRGLESKLEFDLFMSDYTPQQVRAHNAFVISVLESSSEPNKDRKQKASDHFAKNQESENRTKSENQNDPSRKELSRKIALTIPRADRQQIKALNLKRKQAKPIAEPMHLPKYVEKSQQEAMELELPEFCVTSGLLPDHTILKERLARKVQEHGLTTYSDDCLDTILAATEFYMKNVVNSLILKTRAYKMNGNFHYCGITEEEYVQYKQDTKNLDQPTISLPEIFFTFTLSPSLLGENQQLVDHLAIRLKQT